MNSSTNSNLTNSNLKTQILDLPASGAKTKTAFSNKTKPPKLLIFIAALLQKPESQDEHIKSLKKWYKRDLKQFSRVTSWLFLLKNIVIKNWSLFVAVKEHLWKWVKWITGLAVVKSLLMVIYEYFLTQIK